MSNKLARSAVLLLLFSLLLAVVIHRVGTASPARAADLLRPNVVVIQTDDQSLETLRATWRDYFGRARRTMPKTLDLLGAQGVEFTNYYVSNPVCSPSRATLLSGQYSHTSGLRRNTGPVGGWNGWQNLPIRDENLAVALQRAGYRTAHIGKFTNNYHAAEMGTVDTTVPAGWDHWYVPSYGTRLYYYGTQLNVNGVASGPIGSSGYDMTGNATDPPGCTAATLLQPTPGLECNHSTDLFSRNAVEQIEAAGDRPFYIQVDYNTPHGDHRSPAGAEPLSRHYDTGLKTRMPRPAGFNEAAIGDKPSFIRRIPRMKAAEIRSIEARWQKNLEALRGVDDGVGAIVEALRRQGKLSSTYIFFTSDNGLFHGEHRLGSAKFLHYEPSSRVPMLIRGPGIRPGTRSGELVANVDLAPTILGLAGAGLAYRPDGRSLKPFWKAPRKRTRRAIVLESYAGPADVISDGEGAEAGTSAPAPPRNFTGLRAGRYKYIEYTNGERELYDLRSDPAELQNRIRNSAWRRIANRLARELRMRRNCSGAACRKGTGPLPAPPKKRQRRAAR